MGSLFEILETARRALFSQSVRMDTAAHNIANVNTPGYSRQRVFLTPTRPIEFTYGVVGTGVKVQSIERVTSRFIQEELYRNTHQYHYWDVKSDNLDYIEGIFNEPTDYMLKDALSDFFNSWQELAANPEEMATRTNVVQKTKVLVNTFHHLTSELSSLREEMNKSIEESVNKINEIAGDIASLNKEIVSIEANGVSANDLRDKRDELVRQLSEIVNVSTVEEDNGSMRVFISGRSLVDRTHVAEVKVKNVVDSDGNERVSIYWANDLMEVDVRGGKLKGYIETRDELIPKYRSYLDDLASGIIERVNNYHQEGYDLNGSLGVEFFTGTNAYDIDINESIYYNPELIAASMDGTPGDNENALRIAMLEEEGIFDNGMTTFHEYYNRMITSLGSESNYASDVKDSRDVILQNIENRRDALSGVSIDEETSNLIEYQHAYEAAAKLVTTADEMISTLLEMR